VEIGGRPDDIRRDSPPFPRIHKDCVRHPLTLDIIVIAALITINSRVLLLLGTFEASLLSVVSR